MTRIAAVWLMMPSLLMAESGPGVQDAPRVTEIRYEGNTVTRDEVLARELAFVVGDRLTEGVLHRSFQSITDLGLFREVAVRAAVQGDDAVVTVRVREKRFLLPIPRVDGNSDKGWSIGAQLRWNNVAGLNHTLNLSAETGRPEDRISDRESRFRIAYTAPYLFDDHYGMATRYEHYRRDAFGPDGIFDERVHQFEWRALRDARDSRPRRGWVLGAGVFWQDQRTAGPLAPVADGSATALVLTADHTDLRFHIYSETGAILSSRLELARDGLLSDYSYAKVESEYGRYIGLDGGPHHNLNLLAAGGWTNGGSSWRNTFSMGGTTRLRGYEFDYLEGRSYGYAAVEWLRPVGYDWLRLLVVAEAGGTSRSLNAARDGGPYASIGVGFRIRIPWFVGVELEAGIAQPLRGGDGLRFFAGSSR